MIKREGLKDEDELQSYFIRRIEKFLNAHDRMIIGWDEILEGGIAPNATIMSWRGIEGGIAAAKQKHTVIMTPGTHCYFDYYQVPEEAQANELLGYTVLRAPYSGVVVERHVDTDGIHGIGGQNFPRNDR